MYLGNGCSGKRHRIDFREKLFDSSPEFACYLGQNFFERETRYIVLQLFKFPNKSKRNYIRPGRENLPQLDKGRSEFLQGQSHPLGGCKSGDIRNRTPEPPPAAHRHIGKTQHLKYLVEAVFAEHTDDVQITPDTADVPVDFQEIEHGLVVTACFQVLNPFGKPVELFPRNQAQTFNDFLNFEFSHLLSFLPGFICNGLNPVNQLLSFVLTQFETILHFCNQLLSLLLGNGRNTYCCHDRFFEQFQHGIPPGFMVDTSWSSLS